MRIVVLGRQYPPDCLARNVFVALKDMGHDVYSVDEPEIPFFSPLISRVGPVSRVRIASIQLLITRMLPRLEEYIYDQICKTLVPYRPNLIITHNKLIPPRTISKLKQMTGAIIASWFPDHPGNLGREYLLAGDYDVLFFKDKYLVQLAKDQLRKNAFYLPECCQPKWHKRVQITEQEKQFYGCDLTTAGNMYWYRALIFEHFVDHYEVKLWGPPVPKWLQSPVHRVHQNRYVGELEKAKAFNAAKIVLNTFQPGEFQGVNVRVFEAAGCGAFQICEYRPEIEELFVPGEEIVIFRSLDELKEKVDYYLAHPQERQRIADAGYERAHREHTYEKRLQRMLDVVAWVTNGDHVL